MWCVFVCAHTVAARRQGLASETGGDRESVALRQVSTALSPLDLHHISDPLPPLHSGVQGTQLSHKARL